MARPAASVLTRIGTAGWAIPPAVRERFAGEGTRLACYSRVFSCVEINSSFYRPHRHATYARWAASVPDAFRFSVKLPREITHRRRFVDVEPLLDEFLEQTAGLGDKRGVVLVQLPPSFAFADELARTFFDALRARYGGDAACEPRHPSWFDPGADAMLRACRIARVAADPALVPGAEHPGGWDGFAYYRWHGSPRTYWSAYEPARLDELAAQVRAHARPAWCVFDNTAHGAAAADALAFLERAER